MTIHWMKLNIVDREINGRAFAQRRAEAFDAIRANAIALGEATFEEGALPMFFLFKTRNWRALMNAVRDALGDGDLLLSGALNMENANVRRGGGNALAAMTIEQKEATFDEFWR
jgi:hypothetical protein